MAGSGTELELQLLAYSTATAMLDPTAPATYDTVPGSAGSLASLSEARDQLCILMDTSRVLNPLSHSGNSICIIFFFSFYKIIIIF